MVKFFQFIRIPPARLLTLISCSTLETLLTQQISQQNKQISKTYIKTSEFIGVVLNPFMLHVSWEQGWLKMSFMVMKNSDSIYPDLEVQVVLLAEITFLYWIQPLDWLRNKTKTHSSSFNITEPTERYRKVSVIHHHFFKITSVFTKKEKCFHIIVDFTSEKQLMWLKFGLLYIMLQA